MTILAAIQPATGGRTITDPATGEAVGRVAEPGVADLDAAVAAARAAQPGWAARGDAGRAALLSAAADAVEAHAEELAVLLSREQGKPLNGPNARFELEACATWLRATLAVPLDPEVAVDDGETYAEIHHRPLGVVGAIGPWNWPMMISIWQLAPALRMGNTVVIKPSEYTPLSVLALAHVLNTVLPADVLVAVPGGRGVGEALSAHPGIDKLMFTGSTVTGKAIIRASADSVKRVTVELGGNDAGIVLDDADPAAIAEGLFWGAFINTGQTCAALKRLYVPDSLYDAVCDELTKVAAAMPMGVGLDEQNVLGPLQNRQQYDIVAGLVDEARAGGGRVLIGGDPADGPGNFYPTTLVADLPNDNPLVAQEQFGPALPIVRYSSLDEAIAWANGLDVGLGASVWTPSPERARDVALRLDAGTVWINEHGAIDPRVPFGGAKQSGYGVEFARAGLLECAQPVAIKGAAGSFAPSA
ncbi:aldehyde dehydrogenase family protein [Tsukamurella tyrosinosolvens]|uniref:aldehyde dehydrogenase family protein n=1 Tax=Tsukamurella tyrosinosolvens TaxID=57704 RepID=UPI001AF61BE3|nr:aldehyde dehydrogenase family protein [Tsukamurella tyrosinosolvens]QRY82645.1 aldehyde dehydrogenase family protein [Tsukamurella tyrosinosolvens]